MTYGALENYTLKFAAEEEAITLSGGIYFTVMAVMLFLTRVLAVSYTHLISRMIVGHDNRKLIPVSLSLGAAFMAAIDTVSRSLTASELPLSILTSLIGAPFFVFLLKRTKGGGWR